MLSILPAASWTNHPPASDQKSLALYSILPASLPYFFPPAQELGVNVNNALETGRILNHTERVTPPLSGLHVSSWTEHAPILGHRSLDHYPPPPARYSRLGHPAQ